MEKLPAFVKTRAMGGSAEAAACAAEAARCPRAATPEDTFGLLRTLLEGLESRLRRCQRNVERRNALAAATPSIWPAHGMADVDDGSCARPDDGRGRLPCRASISRVNKGQPVYATAAGDCHAGRFRKGRTAT